MNKAPYSGIANNLATYGRYGDSELVHMNPYEVRALAAMSPTGELTTNPVTGQKEAFLPFLAPILGSFLGSAALGGTMTAALGSSALGTAAASAIGSGLATAAATGDLEQGIMSGITGFGIGSAIGAAGAAGAGAAGTAGEAAASNAASSAVTDAATSSVLDPALSNAANGAISEELAKSGFESGILGMSGNNIGGAYNSFNPGISSLNTAPQAATATTAGANTPIPAGMTATPYSPYESFNPSIVGGGGYTAPAGMAGANTAIPSMADSLGPSAASMADQRSMRGIASVFQNPGEFIGALSKPQSFLPIYVGETGRQARAAEIANLSSSKKWEKEEERKRKKALGYIAGVYDRIRAAYPQVGY